MGDDLKRLEEKIRKLKRREAEEERPESGEQKQFAARTTGMRAGSEFMGYIFSGLLVGWLIGHYFGHMALWLIVMMFLGFGLGIYRAAQLMK